MRTFVICVISLAPFLSVTVADEIVLPCIDSDAIDADGTNWGSDPEYVWVPAYWQPGIDHRDGFMKFDLSDIPNQAAIHTMTLRTFHATRPFDPYHDPQVRIYRVEDDAWSNADPYDPNPGLNEVLTPVHTGFPSDDFVPWDWPLDVAAADWTADLEDDLLSLGMRTELEGTWNYVHWYDYAQGSYAPTLSITFTTELPCETDCVRGDTNGDGTLDGEDIGSFVTIMLEQPTCQTLGFCRADMNADEVLDLNDIPLFTAALLAE